MTSNLKKKANTIQDFDMRQNLGMDILFYFFAEGTSLLLIGAVIMC